MNQTCYFLPDSRGLLRLGGDDRVAFLQGLVSNDVTSVAADRVIHAALLTPQGRYLHDFFIAALGDALYVDCEADRRDDLRRRLALYKLRAKVALADATDEFAVACLFGPEALSKLGLPSEPGRAKPFAGGVVAVDPRLAALGARAILPRAAAADRLAAAGFQAGAADDYDRLRLSLGVADGSRDLPIEKAILLENGFDELHGIDWQKGCYVGQELTARTKYRGLVRKRLLPFDIDGETPAPGTPVMLAGKEAGEMRSACRGIGLALVRLEFLDEARKAGGFSAGETRLRPRKPDWMVIP